MTQSEILHLRFVFRTKANGSPKQIIVTMLYLSSTVLKIHLQLIKTQSNAPSSSATPTDLRDHRVIYFTEDLWRRLTGLQPGNAFMDGNTGFTIGRTIRLKGI